MGGEWKVGERMGEKGRGGKGIKGKGGEWGFRAFPEFDYTTGHNSHVIVDWRARVKQALITFSTEDQQTKHCRSAATNQTLQAKAQSVKTRQINLKNTNKNPV